MELKYQNHLRRFMTASGLGVINIGFAVVIGLILSPFVLHSIGDRFYGIFVLVGSFAGWFSLIDFGIPAAVSRFITVHYTRDEYDQCNKVAGSAMLLFLILGAVAFCFMLFAIAVSRRLYPNMQDLQTFTQVMFLFGLAFMVNFPTNVLEGVLCGVLRHDLNASRAIFFRLCGAVGVYLAITAGGGVVVLAVVNLAVNTINLIIIYLLTRSVFPTLSLSPKNFSRKTIAEMTRFSFPVFGNQLGETIIQRSGIVILAVAISIDAVTPYNLVIVSLLGYSTQLFQTVFQWLTNRFTYLRTLENKDLLNDSYRLMVKFSLMTTVFIAFGYLFWGRPFITRWIGEEYLSAWTGLVIAITYFGLCQGPIGVNYSMLLATNKHRFYAFMTILQAIIMVPLAIIFVQQGWGITGIVTATVFPALLCHFIASSIYCCRKCGLSVISWYLDLVKTIALLLPGLILPAIISLRYARPEYLRLFIIAVPATLLYLIYCCCLLKTRDFQAPSGLWREENHLTQRFRR